VFPLWLQNITVFVIAINIGGALDVHAVSSIWRWFPSILGMFFSLWLTFISVCFVLRRIGGFNKSSAFLAAYPGHLVLMLQFANGSKKDLHAITILQSLRVVFLVTVMPVMLHGMSFNEVNLKDEYINWGAVPVVVAVAFFGIVIVHYIRLPAAIMIGAILGAMLASISGVSLGGLPSEIEKTILLFTGVMIGSRFVNADWRMLVNMLPISILTIILALGISSAAALFVGKSLGLPFGQLLLAYAPGAAEVMAIISLTTGYDSSFVGVHHVVRLLLMAVLLPLVIPKE
tara:strand:+ start:10105 stop:10968 length:864 start_codon:yes stop_codon:yes gene_type:complete